jgi:uncharacterized membrane protein YgcG
MLRQQWRAFHENATRHHLESVPGQRRQGAQFQLEAMSMPTAVALVALALVVLLNLVATVMIARSDFETPLQKTLQLVFTWVVPFIGSIVVIMVLRSARSDHEPCLASNSSGDAWLLGSGPQSEGFDGHHGGHCEGGGDAGPGGDGGGGGH